MTKKERENIDNIVEELRESISYLKVQNRGISKLARAYEKAKKLTKEEGETFESVCRKIEDIQDDFNKSINYLSIYGTKGD